MPKYTLRCGVLVGGKRCHSVYHCNNFPEGIRAVYRLGWKFQTWHGGRKFICDRHPQRSIQVGVVRKQEPAPNEVGEFKLVPKEQKLDQLITIPVGTLGATKVVMVYNGFIYHSRWHIEFRDAESDVKVANAEFVTRRKGAEIGLVFAAHMRAADLIAYCAAAGTFEAEILAARREVLKRIGLDTAL